MSGMSAVLAGMINRALDIGISSVRQYQVNPLWGRKVSTPILLTASQNLAIVAARGALTAVGPELAVDGYTRVTLWGTLTPNDATGIRFACFGRHTTGGTNHYMPIFNPSVGGLPYYIDWGPKEVRYADVANPVNFALTWDLANTFPFIQFGAAATGDDGGGVVGVLTNVYVTYGWGS